MTHFLALHNDANVVPHSLSQLVDILSMGFQNKFYNASKKDSTGSSAEGVSEYRINVSSDTPHWYIRDYMARVSSHFNISAVEVDGIVCKIDPFIKLLRNKRNVLLA